MDEFIKLLNPAYEPIQYVNASKHGVWQIRFNASYYPKRYLRLFLFHLINLHSSGSSDAHER